MSINGNIAWTGISTPNSFNNLNVSNDLSVNKVNNFPHTVTVVGYTPVEFVGPGDSFFLMKAPGLNQPDRTVPLDPNKINAITAPPKGFLLGAQILGSSDLSGPTKFDISQINYADLVGVNGNVLKEAPIADCKEGAMVWGTTSSISAGGSGSEGTPLNIYIKIRPDGNVTAGGVKVQLHYLIVDKN